MQSILHDFKCFRKKYNNKKIIFVKINNVTYLLTRLFDSSRMKKLILGLLLTICL